MPNHRSLFILISVLTIFGLVMVGSASVVDASRNFGDKWYYLKLQMMWSGIGLAGLLFFSRFNHLKLQKFALHMLVFNLFLLVLVILPGVGTSALGARRWINLGFFSVQPSEIAKITLAIYFSALFTKKDNFLPFITILGVVCGLVMLQPDLGTSLVIASSALLTYFGSGGRLSRLLAAVVLGIFAVTIMTIAAPYRLNRLKSYLDVSHDPLGSSYQIRQALIALGSGGIFGQGLGQSKQKYAFLPETTTDSIFAIVGEEFGFIGTATVLVAYTLLILQGYQIAKSAKNKFSANLATAITSVLGLQVFINISAISALLPLTGIPLSFISYGGSSLVIMLAAAGILININKTYAKN